MREMEAERNAPELYTIQEVLDLLKKDHFSFDLSGHFNSNFNLEVPVRVKENLIRSLERMIGYYTEYVEVDGNRQGCT
jgi:hypothetical protein